MQQRTTSLQIPGTSLLFTVLNLRTMYAPYRVTLNAHLRDNPLANPSTTLPTESLEGPPVYYRPSADDCPGVAEGR